MYKVNNYSKAIKYFKTVLKIDQIIEFEVTIITIIHLIISYLNMENTKLAELYLNQYKHLINNEALNKYLDDLNNAELQEKIEAANAWELERELDIAADALRSFCSR